MTDADMWLVYKDDDGVLHYQHWNDIGEVGTLIDPDSGDDMAIIGWTANLPTD